MRQNIRCIIALLLIHRSPLGVLKAFRGWKAGTVQVWDLKGEVRR